MKFLVIFAVAIACAVAAPPPQEAEVLVDNRDIKPEGFWDSQLRIDNGIDEMQTGEVVTALDGETKTIIVKGSYTQLGPNNEPQVVNYVADENGYRATGPQVPTAA